MGSFNLQTPHHVHDKSRACCALGYLVCGLLCFDRFRAKAFLTTRDPRITTAIPPANTKIRPISVVGTSDEMDVPT